MLENLFRSLGVANDGGCFLLLRVNDPFGRALFFFSFLLSFFGSVHPLMSRLILEVVAEAECN